MNLGVFLAIGESFSDLESKGQLKRLINYNIHKYSQEFGKVYIFSYRNEKNFTLPKNCKLVPNSSGLHRYIYSILLPFINREEVISCDVLRSLQLSGGIPAMIAKVLYGKKFVINYGYDYAKFALIESKPIQSFLYRVIETPILKLAHAIIVTSSEIGEKLEGKIKRSKINYIPNGVDTKLFKPLGKKQKNSALIITYLGRLEKQKNLDSLIKAVAIIKNQARVHAKNMQLHEFGVGLKLIFYGKGSLKNYLLKLAKKLKVYLEIKPPVNYQSVPKVITSADIFVLPSFHEGNPKILLEAMACQTSVIGTNVSGIREIIINNYNGLLTDISPNSIAQAIKKLESNKLREKLRENARKFIIKNYNILELLNREVDLLKKVAAK